MLATVLAVVFNAFTTIKKEKTTTLYRFVIGVAPTGTNLQTIGVEGGIDYYSNWIFEGALNQVLQHMQLVSREPAKSLLQQIIHMIMEVKQGEGCWQKIQMEEVQKNHSPCVSKMVFLSIQLNTK